MGGVVEQHSSSGQSMSTCPGRWQLWRVRRWHVSEWTPHAGVTNHACSAH